MKKGLTRIMCTLMSLFIIAAMAVVPADALIFKNDIKTESDSIFMINMDTEQVVFEKDADSRRYPASTTKIMTYIVAVENIDNLDSTRIPIKKAVLDELANTGSSLANVSEHIGKTMSVVDLLYSMMVPSGNDAAMVLADYVGGGDIDKFVDMMNEKAKELGCKDTHFQNPDGLHHKEHYTTARDMYLIAKYALTLPRFEEISNTATYYCEDEEYPLITTNYLIDENRGGELYYRYAKGIKTGTTDEAGRCLVTTASADGYSYLAVLLHAPYKEGVNDDEYGTMTDAASLFRWALTQLELKTIKTTQTPICEEKVNYAWGRDKVQLVPEKDLAAIVPSDSEAKNIVVEPDVPESIDAPFDTTTVVGTAKVFYRTDENAELQEIASVNLVPSEKIERSGIVFVLSVVGTVMQSYWFLVIIGLIIIILIVYFILSKLNRKKKRKNRRVKRYRNL